MITGKYPSLRLRRNRKFDWTRRLIRENDLSTNDLILPIFLADGKNKKIKIQSMPGVFRYSVDLIPKVVDTALKNKIPMIAFFPYTDPRKKNKFGTEALNENNLVCRALKIVKEKFMDEIGLMTDVALDPYTSHGHDGLLKDNKILNDETVEILIKQSLLQAEMGCDVLAPSDMMDGRIKKIRKALDKQKFIDVQILSYAVKYASNFYGPFRDAVGSNKILKGDKKTYQMDISNSNEALREVSLDIKEGADIVMVKPGLPYLDIISKIKNKFNIPVFAYQVSGEYSLIKNGVNNNIINRNAIYESLISFKRAGANAIVTYFANDIAHELD
tara:strand:- start:9447 stop:10436 length:990 start_codon:yes stop_codon:yes gene_type:complete